MPHLNAGCSRSALVTNPGPRTNARSLGWAWHDVDTCGCGNTLISVCARCYVRWCSCILNWLCPLSSYKIQLFAQHRSPCALVYTMATNNAGCLVPVLAMVILIYYVSTSTN